MSDYTLVATVKAELGVSDSAIDTRLARLITAASRAIDARCKRPDNFFVGSASGTRVYDVPSSVLDLGTPLYRRFSSVEIELGPCLTVTSVKTDEDGDGTFETTWTVSTDYSLLPLNAILDGVPYTKLRVNPYGSKAMPAGQSRLQVIGTWGYSTTMPPAIEQACILQTIRWLKRPDSPFGVLGSADTGFSRVPGVDPDVVAILDEGGFINEWGIA